MKTLFRLILIAGAFLYLELRVMPVLTELVLTLQDCCSDEPFELEFQLDDSDFRPRPTIPEPQPEFAPEPPPEPVAIPNDQIPMTNKKEPGRWSLVIGHWRF